MNPLPELTPMLKQLRLSGILDSLDARNREAIDAKLAYPEFLALLIQDEVARREQIPGTRRLISLNRPLVCAGESFVSSVSSYLDCP